MPKPVHQLTSAQFDSMFPVGNEDACKAYLKARRWPKGVACPRCGNPAVYDLPSRKWHWQCTKCAPGGSTGYRFSVIAGTIFENTNKPLRDWFKVTHLMLTSKKGMSSRQIGRYMGFGSVKTAWLMCHKIRAALIDPTIKLGGIVEIDETYIGGKDENRHLDKKKGNYKGKTPIIGAVERKGNVVARVLKSVTAEAAFNFVNQVCSNKVSLLATDSWVGYKSLPGRFNHGSVDHHKHQYVIGAIHTIRLRAFGASSNAALSARFTRSARSI